MIKKHYKLIIFILIVLTIFLIYKDNHKNYFNYTSLGDGYALGINSYGQVDYGYSDFIKDALKQEDKLNIYTKDFSEKDQSIEHLYDSIVTNEKITINKVEKNLKQTLRESDLITMTIGLNDLIYHIAITPNMNSYQLNNITEEINQNLNNLITEIKKYYPKKIIIIGYPNIPVEDNYIKEGITKLNEMFQNIDDVIYISTTDIITNQDFLNPNNIYPSKIAYQKIATEVTKKLANNENTWYTNNAEKLLWL